MSKPALALVAEFSGTKQANLVGVAGLYELWCVVLATTIYTLISLSQEDMITLSKPR